MSEATKMNTTHGLPLTRVATQHEFVEGHLQDLEFTNTPNLLTLSRILVVPGVVWLMFERTPMMDFWAAMLFALAGFTDFLDGYIARKRNLVTVYGKLMDPLADKFLVTCCLIALQELGRVHPVVVMLLLCREIGITGLRALASAEGVVIAASTGGKWKTATQMVAIGFLIVRDSVTGLPLDRAGGPLLYFSLAMSLWSARDYAVEFFKGLRATRQKRAERRARKKAKKKR